MSTLTMATVEELAAALRDARAHLADAMSAVIEAENNAETARDYGSSIDALCDADIDGDEIESIRSEASHVYRYADDADIFAADARVAMDRVGEVLDDIEAKL